jgi:hypothetical protein
MKEGNKGRRRRTVLDFTRLTPGRRMPSKERGWGLFRRKKKKPAQSRTDNAANGAKGVGSSSDEAANDGNENLRVAPIPSG